jgi:hypothetical protein
MENAAENQLLMASGPIYALSKVGSVVNKTLELSERYDHEALSWNDVGKCRSGNFDQRRIKDETSII